MRLERQIPSLTEQQALEELQMLFDEQIGELKHLQEGEVRAEEMQAAVCANVMALSFGLGSVLQRLRGLTKSIWNKIRQWLRTYWGQLSGLLLSLQPLLPKLKEWKLEFKSGLNPTVTLSLTFTP